MSAGVAPVRAPPQESAAPRGVGSGASFKSFEDLERLREAERRRRARGKKRAENAAKALAGPQGT